MTESSHFQGCMEQLRRVNLSIRQLLELAEMRIPLLNDQIDRIATTGLLYETALLGEIAFDRTYGSPGGPHDVGEVLQAALLIPGGVGVVVWDSEEYVTFRNSLTPEMSQVFAKFLPFDECRPALRALLLPHVQPLLKRLCRMVRPNGD